jgi:hypothetical protein
MYIGSTHIWAKNRLGYTLGDFFSISRLVTLPIQRINIAVLATLPVASVRMYNLLWILDSVPLNLSYLQGTILDDTETKPAANPTVTPFTSTTLAL